MKSVNKWKVRPVNKEKELELIKKGKNKFLARLLAQRDIEVEEVDSFLDAPYENLSHPHSLKGVEEGVEIFIQCALKKQKVLVVGDYDCDGVISCVMLKELCNIFQMECKVFIPSRFDHGYGLTKESMKSIKELLKGFNPELIIIADSGSSNNKEIQELKDFGVSKVIVIDHHLIDDENISKSADALINWRLSDYQEMCSCGQIFQFIRGIRWRTKKVNPIEFLSYAAVGTLADVIPVVKDNRIIVKHGLGEYALNHVTSSGLISILRKVDVSSANANQQDISFKIAPRINAVGRMEDPNIAYKFLIEHDPEVANEMSECLEECNNRRKSIQKRIEKEAKRIINDNLEKFEHGIAIVNADWPVGVVGIVAAKIAESFLKPVIIVGEHNGKYKGSCRSIGSIDISDILYNCKELFDGYGGHALAAGVTLNKEKIDSLNEVFNKACKKYCDENNLSESLRSYDIEVKPKAASIKVARALRKTLYPYSEHFNPEPIFLISGATINSVNMIGKKGNAATFYVMKDGENTPMQMKVFFPERGAEMEGCKADVYFTFPQTLERDRWGDPTLTVVDILFEK